MEKMTKEEQRNEALKAPEVRAVANLFISNSGEGGKRWITARQIGGYLDALVGGRRHWDGQKIREIIHTIRTLGIVPGIIAGSAGYRVADSAEELEEYEQALKGREDAIRAARLAIAEQRRLLYEERQPTLFDQTPDTGLSM